MEQRIPNPPVYEPVGSIFEEVPPRERETTPSPVSRLLDLADGKVVLPISERRVVKEKSNLVRAAIDELRDFASAQKPDYREIRHDMQYSPKKESKRIDIEDGYIDPKDLSKTPMFRIRLVESELVHRGEYGIIANISFATDGIHYQLSTSRFHKNHPEEEFPIRVSGNLSTITNKTYELLRPIINGYRELAALDRTVDGGERVIPGHTFRFQPLP